uniref:Uncharacterized protein n=1 Tax=Zea mays TaxID=4577 RepID=A0A804PW89_MAIZE
MSIASVRLPESRNSLDLPATPPMTPLPAPRTSQTERPRFRFMGEVRRERERKRSRSRSPSADRDRYHRRHSQSRRGLRRALVRAAAHRMLHRVTFLPIVLYWVYTDGYQLILHPLEQYRLHTLDEEEEKFVSLCTVVCGILLQHLVHVIHVMILFMMMSVFRHIALLVSGSLSYAPLVVCLFLSYLSCLLVVAYYTRSHEVGFSMGTANRQGGLVC